MAGGLVDLLYCYWVLSLSLSLSLSDADLREVAWKMQIHKQMKVKVEKRIEVNM